MTADEILKKYEDDNEYHLHDVDRKWVIAAMEEYAALRQPPVIRWLRFMKTKFNLNNKIKR